MAADTPPPAREGTDRKFFGPGPQGPAAIEAGAARSSLFFISAFYSLLPKTGSRIDFCQSWRIMSSWRRQMTPRPADQIVHKAAWLYYTHGLRQDEVAQRLNISRASVALYL